MLSWLWNGLYVLWDAEDAGLPKFNLSLLGMPYSEYEYTEHNIFMDNSNVYGSCILISRWLHHATSLNPHNIIEDLYSLVKNFF